MDQLFFTATDVARIFTEEEIISAEARGIPASEVEPIKADTVRDYVKKSRPPKSATAKPGMYVNNPMDPMPIKPDGQRLLWIAGEGESMADVDRRLRAWWNGRRGPGRPAKPKGIPA